MASASPSSSERLLAAAGHAAVVLLSGFGILVPILIWVVEPERSRYVRIQALQAVLFGALQFVANLLLVPLFILFALLFGVFGALFALQGGPAEPMPVIMIPVITLFVLGAIALTVFFLLLGLAAAAACLLGYDFRYPLLGQLAERLDGSSLISR